MWLCGQLRPTIADCAMILYVTDEIVTEHARGKILFLLLIFFYFATSKEFITQLHHNHDQQPTGHCSGWRTSCEDTQYHKGGNKKTIGYAVHA
jgi:hypothetical protein